MGNAAKSLLDQALQLSARERTIMAEQLLLSLDKTDAKMDEIWAKEAEVRIDAMNRCELHKVPTEAVLNKYL